MSTLLPFISLGFFLSLTQIESRQIFAADDFQTLDIQIREDNIALVEARVEFQVPPEVVFTVLTDYPNWPVLFSYGVEVQVEKFPDDSVIIDLTIPHKVLSWTTRLKVKSRETPPHKLETTLVDGDFLQYEQVWQLTPMQDGKYTRGELTLVLQPKGWIMKLVPDFLYKWLLRGDLEAHFEKFQKQVQLRQGTK